MREHHTRILGDGFLSRVDQIPDDWAALGSVLSGLKHVSVLVVGDLMLDEYLYGAIDRISPEAPVGILNWRSQRFSLGGAANVANNLAQLGCEVFLAGVVGRDHSAEELLQLAKQSGIHTEGVVVEDRPTTLKTRVIGHGQQVLRIDKETCSELNEHSTRRFLEFVQKRLPLVDGVVLSDYAKGVLGPGICKSLVHMALATRRRLVVDPKGDDFSKYRGAFLLTPNKAELGRATQLPVRNEDEVRRAIAHLFAQTECEAILVTRSEEGMSLHTKEGSETYIQTEARDVFDITGAGDTVISMIARVFFAGHDLETAARLANVAAGIKVGKFGAAPVCVDEISAWMRQRENQGRRKLVELAQAKQLVSLARSQGRKIVFTNGCFDLLHAGHVQLLQQAKALGHILIVAINDDASVRQLKGNGRPLISVFDRARIIAALESVDYVIIFSDPTPLRLIEELMPDVLVKGGNYSLEEVIGRKEVEKYGGRVALVPTIDTQSSSQIIKEIVARYQFTNESAG
ncbi:MAG: bifunctional heptose 7-phosphate kinase/heptose 1-phosphate adenyltransferase [Acidobacteria bacterium]|nr:MAG: bifunctional heptose 7-phosphate kinase/heptose 1-phosphate adenyltransferase [Acidobacteriota bacterium]